MINNFPVIFSAFFLPDLLCSVTTFRWKGFIKFLLSPFFFGPFYSSRRLSADVCLFAIYTQEYGSECPYPNPNRGRVYLSYIDSVKYFRPDSRAANVQRLRTYVYHEILIGYLDYCKKRGLNSCHLWVCPPQRKADYILHSHPMEQKMITSDLLRVWYNNLIHKTGEENIVAGSTYFYDKYFTTSGSKLKINVVPERLPDYDGDFWPTKVEQILRENESAMKEKAKELVSDFTRKKHIEHGGYNSCCHLHLQTSLGGGNIQT